jgi:thiol-disulfide isomerase/thioredoxin
MPTAFKNLLRAMSMGFVLYLIGGTAITQAAEPSNNSSLSLQNGVATPYAAPPISGISSWINSDPIQLSELQGKVVLIEFWTYTCINCKRTLPYVIDWYAKYHHAGLIIIGVHSPEFDFEKTRSHVQEAVQKEGILFPVAQDNQFETWRNYNNNYWPAQYLIDKKGNVVYQHFGEGDYSITENNIRLLLGM